MPTQTFFFVLVLVFVFVTTVGGSLVFVFVLNFAVVIGGDALDDFTVAVVAGDADRGLRHPRGTLRCGHHMESEI